jgi:hypothetical protein
MGGLSLEKVQTKEDVHQIFEAGQKLKSLQMKFFQGLRENDPKAISIHREIDRIRREIHKKYRVLI